jgi:hypothetical protein
MKALKDRYVNTGTVSGVIAVLSGVATLLLELGGLEFQILTSVIGILAGLVTTRDSAPD